MVHVLKRLKISTNKVHVLKIKVPTNKVHVLKRLKISTNKVHVLKISQKWDVSLLREREMMGMFGMKRWAFWGGEL